MTTPDDSLLCPITLELFRDPVLAQDGHTYERQAIVEWIEKNGRSPITDQQLSLEHLYPNYAIKKAVDHFEKSMKNKNYHYILDIDVKRKSGRPLFQTFGKTIYYAEWLPTNNNRPEIILLKIDGARAKKEAAFYVDLSRHPHIVRTYGFVYEDNNEESNAIMLLQEHASMGSLYDLLQERKKVPDEQILVQMFLQILDAMIFSAFNNVVHGDLACRNVLVFRFDENNPRNNIVKITDFGLSRHSSLYSLAPGAAKTTLNIIPVRYVAPEILSKHVTPYNDTEKSDVYSMGVLIEKLILEALFRGQKLVTMISESCWSIICKTWSKLPKDRPTFSELKYLLTQQYYDTTNIMPSTISLSSSNEEFKSVEKQFLYGWPNELRCQVRVDAIHKINNSSLESRYQQFVRSNSKFARQECIGWHGTSAKCHNGSCMSPTCSLCQIVKNGFNKDCARKDTNSFRCWGNATYFADQSFVCQTYNRASQINNPASRRCTIMAKINRGCTVRGEELIETCCSQLPLAMLISRMNFDTVVVSRNYYVAPTDYLLLYNNFAAVPTYIVVYSVSTRSLQVRTTKDDYCSFHNEYHGCGDSCDGHWTECVAGCLGSSNSVTPSTHYDGNPRGDPYKFIEGPCADSMERNILIMMEKLRKSNSS